MEKQANPRSPLGKKRKRKTSSGITLEPKHIRVDTLEGPSIFQGSHLTKSKRKISAAKVNLPDSLTKLKPDESGETDPKPIIDNRISTDEVNPKKHKKSPPETNSGNFKPATADIKVISHKKKNKKFKVTTSEPKSVKIEVMDTSKITEKQEDTSEKVNERSEKLPERKIALENTDEKYPILNNKVLIERFMKVPLSNNQKGRIRLAIKSSLQGTTNTMFPEIINGKIQGILKGSQDLTNSELRRIRILYNMLKMALDNPSGLEKEEKTKPNKKKKKEKDGNEKNEDNGEKKEKLVQKVKGPKRYVVFLGNLPLDINKEQIMEHFRELNEQIKDVRVPKVVEGKNRAIAYMELSNEPSYELALSKHHTMLGNIRINVLYTTQQQSKISKSEAKSKSAKLIAMQKSGKLIGSTPLGKKRSHRRAIKKQARAKEAETNG